MAISCFNIYQNAIAFAMHLGVTIEDEFSSKENGREGGEL
jgi:hypothetical protein